MTRWSLLDWIIVVGPFVILAAMAWCAVRRARRAVPRP